MISRPDIGKLKRLVNATNRSAMAVSRESLMELLKYVDSLERRLKSASKNRSPLSVDDGDDQVLDDEADEFLGS